MVEVVLREPVGSNPCVRRSVERRRRIRTLQPGQRGV
jgi:hypothetical protein